MTTSHTRRRIATAIAAAALVAGAGSLGSPASAANMGKAATAHSIAAKVPGKPKVDCATKATAKAQAKCQAKHAAKQQAKAAKKAAAKAAKAARKAAQAS